ncbi:protein xap5 circadian timekeeper-like [Phytophthora cinnamomi]|uniref:protein xap5 circadian timekeeper-like n=1 Tax=Phytophthora cinnamomi TaxID=4785 RepID=UPI0035594440|nr:protein xap5 circadian timekeeper-like [Phytophthora cinnamomi]
MAPRALTVEGNDIERTNRRGTRIDANFQSHQDDDESEFKRQTVGLVTAEEFRKKREDLQNRKSAPVDVQSEEKQKEPKKKKRKQRRWGRCRSIWTAEDEADEELHVKPSV